MSGRYLEFPKAVPWAHRGMRSEDDRFRLDDDSFLGLDEDYPDFGDQPDDGGICPRQSVEAVV